MQEVSNATRLHAGKRKDIPTAESVSVRRKLFQTFHFAVKACSVNPTNPASGSWIGSSMVEQLTLNQLVEGSSPSRSTKKSSPRPISVVRRMVTGL